MHTHTHRNFVQHLKCSFVVRWKLFLLFFLLFSLGIYYINIFSTVFRIRFNYILNVFLKFISLLSEFFFVFLFFRFSIFIFIFLQQKFIKITQREKRVENYSKARCKVMYLMVEMIFATFSSVFFPLFFGTMKQRKAF